MTDKIFLPFICAKTKNCKKWFLTKFKHFLMVFGLYTLKLLKSWYQVETVPKKMRQWLKCTINEKSTILMQSHWYFGHLIYSWVLHFDQVSWWLDKNCGIFINDHFLGVSHFFRNSLYSNIWMILPFDCFILTFMMLI